MSHVLIIGNGFDLNLGLKTSYRDFIGSKFFTRNLGDSSLPLFAHLEEVDKTNWIDIEKELESYSKSGVETYAFLLEYKKLCEELKSYIKSIELEDVDQSSHAYRLLENISREQFLILNFNYTNSVEVILNSLGVPPYKIDESIIHVHGSVKQDDIIFGVDDDARINNEHSFLRKTSSSLYDGEQVMQALNDFERLSIFGHSLGESDHMYFKCFQNLAIGIGRQSRARNQRESLNLYYYDEMAKYQLLSQIYTLSGRKMGQLKDNLASFKEIDVSK
ncbi:AbiH family protein [Marinomonas shanghaiensis]|uniref:AbiH family protein n=1 Tax=Marinomonas shanghaiensis TaxID=2202418 RepID=UPI003A95DDAB